MELLDKPGLKHTKLSDSRKGDLAEQFVCFAAGLKGAEVFRNVGADGSIDIVLKIDKEFVPIDVKLANFYINNKGRGSWKFSAIGSQCSEDVYPVMVVPETGTDWRGWSIRWFYKKGQGQALEPKYNCPPGLETFWH